MPAINSEERIMPNKTPSTYQLRKKEEEKDPEVWCRIMHHSIEEALVHAEITIGIRDSAGREVVQPEPYLGTTDFGTGIIVGWKIGSQKRGRLDFAHDFERQNQAATEGHGVNKGTRGVHVNEGNFLRTIGKKVCHPTTSSLDRANGYWRKWISQYGRLGEVKPEHVKR
jgi:hypothetical protein